MNTLLRTLSGAIARLLLPRSGANRLLDDLDDEVTAYRGQRRTNGWWYLTQVIRSIPSARALPDSPSGYGMADVLRDSSRRLLRSPGYTLTAVATLALGIGASTAIYAVVEEALLEPLPYSEPDRILRAWAGSVEREISDFSFRVAEYEVLSERAELFEAVGGEFPLRLTYQAEGDVARQIEARMITPNFFAVFGVTPQLGRVFNGGEISEGTHLAAVISHSFWTDKLGADPAVVGRSIELGGRRFQVAGILPSNYRHVSAGDPELFVPYTIGTSGWIGRWLDLYLRVQPGLSSVDATSVLNGVMEDVAIATGRNAGWSGTTVPLAEELTADVKPALLALVGMVALLLLIACVNVANLTLARGTMRSAEIAVRESLGASRQQIISLRLAESTLLAAMGGVTGLIIAWLGIEILIRLAPSQLTHLGTASIDPSVLAAALLVTASTVVLFGVLPSLNRPSASRSVTSDRSTGRLLGGMVVVELALTTALVIGAGLMVRTLDQLQAVELGFRSAGATTVRVHPPAHRYGTAEELTAYFRELQAHLVALPEVSAVGILSDAPLTGTGAVAGVNSIERVARGVEERISALQRWANSEAFVALGTPLIEGRAFTAADALEEGQVAILSASLAAQLFPDGNAIGSLVGWGSTPSNDEAMTVVGVVADVRYEGVAGGSSRQIYEFVSEAPIREVSLIVRFSEGAGAAGLDLLARIQALDPGVAAFDDRSLQSLVDASLAGRSFAMRLFGLFAGVALVLSGIGVFGMLSFSTGRRRRELGVRRALGADAAQLARDVLGRALTMAAAGVGIGLGFAAILGGFVESLLFGVTVRDPATFGFGAGVLLLVGVVAAAIPAWKAASSDPRETLTAE